MNWNRVIVILIASDWSDGVIFGSGYNVKDATIPVKGLDNSFIDSLSSTAMSSMYDRDRTTRKKNQQCPFFCFFHEATLLLLS